MVEDTTLDPEAREDEEVQEDEPVWVWVYPSAHSNYRDGTTMPSRRAGKVFQAVGRAVVTTHFKRRSRLANQLRGPRAQKDWGFVCKEKGGERFWASSRVSAVVSGNPDNLRWVAFEGK